MPKNIKVSFIVPCFNQESFIEECLNSVKNQTIIDWECIIINDGSTDNSLDKIKLFLNDSRYKLIDSENKGVSNARNLGLKQSKGKYILPLDGDDKISSTYLEEALNVYKQYPETDLVYCNASFFGNKEGHWDLPEFNYESILQRNLIFCTALYKRAVLSKGHKYDVNLIHGYEDWDFWLQILNKKSKVIRLKKTHFYYRQRNNSRDDFTNNSQKFIETENYIFNKHFKKYNDLINKKTSLDLLRSYTSFQKEIEIKQNEFLQKETENQHHINLLHQKEKENQHHINLLHQKEKENQHINFKLKRIKNTISYKVFFKIEIFLKELLLKLFN